MGNSLLKEEVEGGRALEVDGCSTITLSGTSLKDSSEGKSSQEAELQAVYLVVHFG